nr:aminotransferase class V-fold PLP-dependent enzyme [Maliibacterium massiliense]
MIYLDNAATTFPKPASVVDAVQHALCSVGNPGRAGHDLALEAGRVVARARQALCTLFGVDTPERFVFGYNTTDALNTAIRGILPPDAHVVTTSLEHNSVLRPLYALQSTRRTRLSVVPPEQSGVVSAQRMADAITPNTALVVMTHVSNVTGALQPIEQVAELCRARGVPLLVDAAQSAGSQAIDLAKTPIDLLAFPGHKGLYGPQGTGGLYVRPGIALAPSRQGGTGVQSFSVQQPAEMPERLESGTLNAHGIAGLLAGIETVLERTPQAIAAHERGLANRLIDGLLQLQGCTIYSPEHERYRTGVVAFNIGALTSEQVADSLSRDYGICVRAGIHCAPLLHQLTQTTLQGAVRASMSIFNTQDDIDALLDALREIAKQAPQA